MDGVDLTVKLVTLTAKETVTSSHGLRIHPDGVLASPAADGSDHGEGSAIETGERPDIVVVPGGGWQLYGEAGVRTQVEHGELPQAIGHLFRAGTTVASVCTGGMVLAAAGITKGRPAVTHRSALDDLLKSGATIVEHRVVDDGDLLTAGGITVGIDLALHIVEREFGDGVAERVATVMEYPRQGDVYEG